MTNIKANQPTRNAIKRLYWGLGFLVIAIIAFALILILPDKTTPNQPEDKIPVFSKHGTASFMDTNGKTLATFDIEIADTPDKLKQGLMYRDSLARNQAMLFLMPANEPQSFWMKDTYLALDIIFIAADSSIVSISANTRPFSEEQLQSTGPALYVLEINAGLASKFNLKPGDRFVWSRLQN